MQQVALKGLLDCAPQRKASLERNPFQRLRGGLADAARGRVDDPFDGNRIVGVLNGFEIRDHVFDLGALVEAEASHNVVLQLIAPHRFFQQSGLRIGAIEHGRAGNLSVV